MYLALLWPALSAFMIVVNHLSVMSGICKTSREMKLEIPALRLEDDKQVFWCVKVLDTALVKLPSIRIGLEEFSQSAEKHIVTA